MVNATAAYQKKQVVNIEALVFTIFAPDLSHSFYVFATYLPRANSCKSIFSSQFLTATHLMFPGLPAFILFVFR